MLLIMVGVGRNQAAAFSRAGAIDNISKLFILIDVQLVPHTYQKMTLNNTVVNRIRTDGPGGMIGTNDLDSFL